ncbi:uncharacterized protein LOC119741865 [Patiria miniata]|uniref:Uncharacterized protein n=1 Tax=Patiria miniata TaxID=46514 RepID=A0A914BCE3_PATMI|nr:uncharacterized protein LOC119741865 [Patiria miniata]
MNGLAKSKGMTTTTTRSKKIPGRSFEKPKTLSYTQLKEENGILKQRSVDLENKVSKQSSALNVAQRNAKTFEKENKTLKEQLEEEKQQNTEYVESVTKEWTAQKETLTDKLVRCETKLEDLGVNPVTLSDCSNTEDEDVSKREALKRAVVLKEKLVENISNGQNLLHKIQEITMQSRDALKQLDS